MTLIITVLHVLVSLTLIFIVLLQKGSGADMGAAFGGSSQSVFGSRGSGSFLGKLTAGLATVFMLTSLSLAFFTNQKGEHISVMEKVPAAERKQTTPTKTEPVVPSGPPIPAKMADQPKALVTPAQPVDKDTIPALPEQEKGQESVIPSVPKSNP